MTETEKLREQLEAKVQKLSYLDDKANVQTGIGVVLTSLFGFTVMLAFFALWISEEYGDRAPLAVDLVFYAGLVAWMVSTTVLVASLANITFGIKLRKETRELSKQVEQAEANDLDFQVKQLATAKAKEQAELFVEERNRAAAVAASDAREAQARAEQAERVAKAVQTTRDERRATQAQNPGYGRSEGQNKPGGSPTQGKGSSPRRDA